MALGLHDKGSALVRQGDAETGVALIDEATVAAVSGDLDPYVTGIIYCGVISASFDVADSRARATGRRPRNGGASASRSAASPGSAV